MSTSFIFSCSVFGRIFEKIDEKNHSGFVPYSGEGDLSEDKLKSCLECLAQVFNSIADWTAFGKENSKSDGCDTKRPLFPSCTELGWRSNFTREELTRWENLRSSNLVQPQLHTPDMQKWCKLAPTYVSPRKIRLKFAEKHLKLAERA